MNKVINIHDARIRTMTVGIKALTIGVIPVTMCRLLRGAVCATKSRFKPRIR